ncbi:hypothetical protein M514_05433 [Trichuris suis]|uniref:NADH dehydrogenase [ubiquinone] 1 alpha subcomplex subunit 11 n=1 Tax=Trichuris suis TaxID=68888 RepID=A0A085M932_9BILA|nr:hypothetical protein M513_05433 [Trichuris suis]KFD72443.1 hypothetical protein M514_05433 [Trichuris suis]
MPKHITEFGYEDPVEKLGRWRPIYPQIRERDPLWIDRPIKDSKLAAEGVDTTYSYELYFRERPGLPDDEWRKKLYFNSPNIKRIYDNWNISKEHPGFNVQPYLYGPEAPISSFSHSMVFPARISTYLSKYLPFMTWSYYDGPFGENCLKKTVAPLRTMTYLSSIMWMFHVCYYRPADSFMSALRRYPGFCTVPILSAGVWGGLSCVACQYRKKDDWKNMAIGGVGVGLVNTMKYSAMRSIVTGAVIAGLSSMWRYCLDFETGFISRGMPRKQLYFHDPLSWQWMSLETSWSDVPPRDW